MESQVLLDGIEDGETFEGIVYVVFSKVQMSKVGKEYLNGTIADKSGEFNLKSFDNFSPFLPLIRENNFIFIKAKAGTYQSKRQFMLLDCQSADEAKIPWENFRKKTPYDIESLWKSIQNILSDVKSPYWKEFLVELWKVPKLVEKFKIYPAAKNVHHADPGGLIFHCNSILKSLQFHLVHYKQYNLNHDLVLIGGLLHDIGKIDELSYDFRTEYTLEGQLVGHLVMGVELVEKISQKIPNLPYVEKIQMKHIILSHHGELEFGSPKVPMTSEALLVHMIDYLDSKMETISEHMKREGTNSSGFTPMNRFMDRNFYFQSKDQNNFQKNQNESMNETKLGDVLKKAAQKLNY